MKDMINDQTVKLRSEINEQTMKLKYAMRKSGSIAREKSQQHNADREEDELRKLFRNVESIMERMKAQDAAIESIRNLIMKER